MASRASCLALSACMVDMFSLASQGWLMPSSRLGGVASDLQPVGVEYGLQYLRRGAGVLRRFVAF